MLHFVRFFYTILYTRTGGEGRGDVGVSLLIVFKHLQICKRKGLFHPFVLMQSCSYKLLKLQNFIPSIQNYSIFSVVDGCVSYFPHSCNVL